MSFSGDAVLSLVYEYLTLILLLIHLQDLENGKRNLSYSSLAAARYRYSKHLEETWLSSASRLASAWPRAIYLGLSI